MTKKVVIVESPAKAKTISKFLGKDYKIVASMGHIRDLPTNRLGFDPENNFEPEYEVSKDKKKVVTELKKQISKDTEILLATDEDREGEAISWHLIYALNITKNPLKRIVFHEITKTAILKALETPRDINQNQVDAQQARRILDRAVGYELSPLLWKKIKGGLSAGRVQSTAVKIIVDRENEIRAFKPEEFWKIKALFQKPELLTELDKVNGKKAKVSNEKEAKSIESSTKKGSFIIKNIQEKEGKRKAPLPFTTSTLQQEAARKLGFSVRQTMIVAQQLYEGNFDIPNISGGLITYMRTDSVTLSKTALAQAKKVIINKYGKEYSETRQAKTKTKGAQEAHEAIRPTDLSLDPKNIKNHVSPQLFKLYDLIWKRTLATQMTDAKIANTTVHIEAGEKKELEFICKGQKIIFPGFMKVYTEGSDDPDAQLANTEHVLPPLKKDQKLNLKELQTEQHFTKPPPRYTEASLVKKLESEGVGRPSTYAPTISTIQTRGYVEKQPDKKLAPTDIGEVVNNFLVKHFYEIVEVGFTAKMEESLDEIAKGSMPWKKLLKSFYGNFHSKVEEKNDSVSRDEVIQARELGVDPESKKMLSVRIGRYGPIAQIGTKDDKEKPRFAPLPKGKSLTEITFEEALALFELPKTLGTFEDKDIIVNIGRFGPYVKLDSDFFSIKEKDPYDLTKEEAIEIIKEGLEAKKNKFIKVFDEKDIQILNGRYGPYIKHAKKNYRIPKDKTPEKLTLEDCLDIIEKKKK